MRLINADVLKKDLTRFYDNEVTAKELIDEQPTIGGWVNVKDRLPEKHTKLGEGWWAGTDGAVYGAIGFIHEPTHWMPLPEPPED